MKKKVILIIFTCVYALAVAAGFFYAKARNTSEDQVSRPMTFQSNWVVLRVDDMTSENPHLVSVWVMLSSFSSAPQVFFKPIFSTEMDNTVASDLAGKFAVNPDRALNAQFITELNKLNIQRSGLVILDNEGFQNFTAWFTPSASSGQLSEVRPVHWQTYPSSGSEASAYQKICAALQSQNRSKSVTLHWQELTPNHLILHPNLDLYANMWNKLIYSSITANCTVISGP